MEMYSAWDIDFIKVDDIAFSKIYPDAHLDEIKAIRESIDRINPNIILSLSPGPANLRDGSFLQEHANMWRLTDDFWDEWPMVLEMFERCNQWSPFIRPGSWPDCDMLPLGHIAIRSDERGVSERDTRLTRDEQRTMMTLWSLFQSPLMFGGELTLLDDWTFSLLANKELTEMHLKLKHQKQVWRDNTWIVWQAEADDSNYTAIFNISDTHAILPHDIAARFMPAAGGLEMWSGQSTESVRDAIPSHGCLIFRAI